MGDKEDYLTSYRVFFEHFAATVNPDDQLPVHVAGYNITKSELPGEIIYWTTQYLAGKECPQALMTPLRRIVLEEVLAASKKQPNDFGYKPDDSVYVALRLMQSVTARVNSVCLRYLDNSQLDKLPPPAAVRDRLTSSAATKNLRRFMEDRHVEFGNLEALFGIETTEPTSFYAVYDGHAGSVAATYCAAHLHQYLVESVYFKTDLIKALREAFLRTDAEFVRKSNNQEQHVCGGSTAVVVVIRGSRLHAAWAGDSQALLAKGMQLLQLVSPHKPDRPDERKRIEAAGGTVIHWGIWRVNAQLAVSRAIGDAQYKPYVTADPEFATVDLDGEEDFVVLACDGLWDFVSEDGVALAVYWQVAEDPDDLNAVSKRLVLQAKKQKSSDNISAIVVFLKEPRDIAAENIPPMELGLDNALANPPPPFAVDEACKLPAEVPEPMDTSAADNGVDNSDSDSEDLGPETAVDIDDAEAIRHADPPTPLVDTVEQTHVDGVLEENVGESGDESEDEWNYFKGEKEKEQEEQPPSEPRSETPCQDNSGWESSSVDMNSSPLNPDAPVFIPGVGMTDVLLAQSPRKPLPMDENVPQDDTQFKTELGDRPADLLDLDNCEQLNGHHNILDDAAKVNLNGNEKGDMESLGFGFDSDKTKDTKLIQDLERIQKDTTDFCNIEVFQMQTESNVETEEELIERLKNKECDPMSMSFYQEKDDDTCENILRDPKVDLNAVQMLPESDDDTPNGVSEDMDIVNKENIIPEDAESFKVDKDVVEPNNDIICFDDKPEIVANDIANFEQGENLATYNTNVSDTPFTAIDFGSNVVHETVLQTDTPESHKLLFEQIPEIPDGKSSELGFVNEDEQVHLESEAEIRPESNVSDLESHEIGAFDSQFEEKIDDASEKVNPFGDHLNSEVANMEETPTLVEPSNPFEDFNQRNDFSDNLLTSNVNEFNNVNEVCVNGETQDVFNEEELDIIDVVIGDAGNDLVEPQTLVLEDDNKETTELNVPQGFTQETFSPYSQSPLPVDTHTLQATESPLPNEHIPSQSPLPNEANFAEPPVTHFPVETVSPLPTETEILKPDESRELVPEENELAPVKNDICDIITNNIQDEPTIQSSFTDNVSEGIEDVYIHGITPQQFLAKLESSSGPTPDIVPEEYIEPHFESHSVPVTDLDLGFTESRAQEICMPVTNEINEDIIEANLSTPTPPPTPAVEPSAPQLDEIINTESILSKETPDKEAPSSEVAIAAATAAVATAAAAAVASKAKTPAKKAPATPKSTTKPAVKATPTAKTPVSVKKATTTPAKSATPAAKLTATPKPASATKVAAAPKTTPLAKPKPASTTSSPRVPLTKPAAPKSAPIAAAAKPAPITAAAKPAAAKPLAAKPAPRPAAPKPLAAKPAPKPAVPAAKLPAAGAPRPATSASRTATTTTAPKSAPPRMTKPREPLVKPTEKKPLTNGDVKAPIKKTTSTVTSKPAPRPAPRSAPSTVANKTTTAPKPLARARPPLDKQSKDLANKRITAKAAPPRTATTKVPPAAPERVERIPPIRKPDVAKAPLLNGLKGGEDKAVSPPPPPPTDNTLLPDVIA